MEQIKTSLFSLLLVLGFSCGQIAFAQSFNLKGGVSFSKLVLTDDGENVFVDGNVGDEYYSTNKFVTTYNAGATYNFRLSPSFRLETGLLFSGKGTNASSVHNQTFPEGSSEYIVNSKVRMFSADIPLLVKYGFTKNKLTYYASLGGTFGMTLLANATYTEQEKETYNGSEYSSDFSLRYGMDLENGEDRINMGPMVGLGIEFDRYFFETYYGISFFNKLWDVNGSSYNHNFHVTFGVMFNRTKNQEK